MNFYTSISDYLFASGGNKSISQREIRERADAASPAVLNFIQQGTSTGDMQAIRQYRRETGASLAIAHRVFKELKWRSTFPSS